MSDSPASVREPLGDPRRAATGGARIMRAAPAVRLDLKPSRGLVVALALVHALAFAAAWVGLGGTLRYLAWAFILVSLGSTLAQVLLRTRGQAISLELHDDGRASWRNRDGVWHEGRIGRSHFVSPAFAIAELEPEPGRIKRVMLMADSVSPEDFRRLQVWLRWRRDPTRPGSE